MQAQDLARALTDMTAARGELLALVSATSADDLARSRPGGWTLRRVLHHVIESEAVYAKLLAHQCGVTASGIDTTEPADGPDAAGKLASARGVVTALVDGIDDETLYRLVRFGHEEYSPLSVLQNIASHDRDHQAQIAELLRSTTPAAPATPGVRTADGVAVRPARAEDLPRLTEIYNHYVVQTPTTFDLEPFTLEQRAQWFSHYAATGRHRLLVAERDGAVVAYTSSSQFRPKRAYETTVEMTVVCAPEAVGYGIGQRLYEAIFPALAAEDIHRAVAAITLPNDASCLLHERFGFHRVGVLREVGRKFGRYWDVVWYERALP